jgi:hypothetical protein
MDVAGAMSSTSSTPPRLAGSSVARDGRKSRLVRGMAPPHWWDRYVAQIGPVDVGNRHDHDLEPHRDGRRPGRLRRGVIARLRTAQGNLPGLGCRQIHRSAHRSRSWGHWSCPRDHSSFRQLSLRGSRSPHLRLLSRVADGDPRSPPTSPAAVADQEAVGGDRLWWVPACDGGLWQPRLLLWSCAQALRTTASEQLESPPPVRALPRRPRDRETRKQARVHGPDVQT